MIFSRIYQILAKIIWYRSSSVAHKSVLLNDFSTFNKNIFFPLTLLKDFAIRRKQCSMSVTFPILCLQFQASRDLDTTIQKSAFFGNNLGWLNQGLVE